MMGQLPAGQNQLFYDFCLEKYVPQKHVLRSLDRFLDFGDIRKHLAPYYSAIGRPSIDPELMIRMLLVGYCFGIRSERRLCEEVHLNLAYRWFCGLGLEDKKAATVANHVEAKLRRLPDDARKILEMVALAGHAESVQVVSKLELCDSAFSTLTHIR